MNHRTLREIAKIGSGLVIADIISAIWFSSAGLLPMTLLGVRWTSAMVPEILVFDVALLILLIHYGWNMRLPVTSPSERALLYLVGTVFLAVALAHFLRITLGWNLILGTYAVPIWISWIGVVIAAYFSYSSFHFARHMRR